MRARTIQLVSSIMLCFSVLLVAETGQAGINNEPEGKEATLKTKMISFENCIDAPFTFLKTKGGNWNAGKGHVKIDNQHAKTGQQCLHLLGGENRSVEFSPTSSQSSPARLTFWAECWTRRAPFDFHIDRFYNGKWIALYNGTKTVRIGHFATKVEIDLTGKPASKYRFVCSSPKQSGILIDDIELIPPTIQRITAVAIEPITLPVLVGVSASPLLRIRVEVEGTNNPISLISLTAKLSEHTDVNDLQSLHVFSTGQKNTLRAVGNPDCYANATRFGTAINAITNTNTKLFFKGAAELQHGSNYIWIAATLKKDANVDQVMQISCEQITDSQGKTHKPIIPQLLMPKRIGIAVRKQGDDDSHTYRIPGLATTNNGTLIGVYDIRRRKGGDLPGDIDVGMSRSTDGGRTWEPMRTIMDMGDDPNWQYDGIGDPAVLVDQKTGTVWVAATWSHGNRSWRGSGPGLKAEETGQLMLVKSDDQGRTWSKPINITSQVKNPKWCFLLQGPGKGITMRDGTIVFAAQYQDSPEEKRLPHSSIIYSKNHGTTWNMGTGAFDDTTEAQVVEIEPGVLMLNCRYNRQGLRVVMTTRDMGKTWKEHSTSRKSLIEPGSCMASLIDVDQETGKEIEGWLLFSNPNSSRGRKQITIKASRDKGKTWLQGNQLLLDQGTGAGYSCMSMIDAETVGILYEGSLAHMTFQRIKLRDILKAKQGTKK